MTSTKTGGESPRSVQKKEFKILLLNGPSLWPRRLLAAVGVGRNLVCPGDGQVHGFVDEGVGGSVRILGGDLAWRVGNRRFQQRAGRRALVGRPDLAVRLVPGEPACVGPADLHGRPAVSVVCR